MIDDIINFVKIVYERKPCKKCGGQVMTIYIVEEMIDRRCIKCDNFGIRIRPTCEEERMGRLMHIYGTQRKID